MSNDAPAAFEVLAELYLSKRRMARVQEFWTASETVKGLRSEGLEDRGPEIVSYCLREAMREVTADVKLYDRSWRVVSREVANHHPNPTTWSSPSCRYSAASTTASAPGALPPSTNRATSSPTPSPDSSPTAPPHPSNGPQPGRGQPSLPKSCTHPPPTAAQCLLGYSPSLRASPQPPTVTPRHQSCPL